MERPIHRLSAPIPRPITGVHDLARGNFVQTCSVVFRRDRLPEFPEWYDLVPLGDWPLYIFLAERGDLAYLDEIWATYRVHSGGLWSEQFARYRSFNDIAG